MFLCDHVQLREFSAERKGGNHEQHVCGAGGPKLLSAPASRSRFKLSAPVTGANSCVSRSRQLTPPPLGLDRGRFLSLLGKALELCLRNTF